MAGPPIKVFRERLDSENYWIRPNGKLGKPIIIDIRESHISDIRRTREDAETDVNLLLENLPKLGFEQPYLISSNDTNTTMLREKETFFKELERIAQDDSITKDADVFLCIIMAHGDGNVFYLPNSDRLPERDRYTVDINDVINIFKSDHCYRLVCKPKIFIMHTDDYTLRKIDKSLYQDGPGDPPQLTARIPVEADILVYQSKLSALYSKFIAKVDPDKYEELRQRGLVPDWDEHISGNGGGDTPRKPQKGTQFIYLLCEAVKTMIKEERFDLMRWIFLTNDSIYRYLKTRYWVTWRQGCWTIEPVPPLCTIHLTKPLMVDLRMEEDME